jgi:hypothetical protein
LPVARFKKGTAGTIQPVSPDFDANAFTSFGLAPSTIYLTGDSPEHKSVWIRTYITGLLPLETRKVFGIN